METVTVRPVWKLPAIDDERRCQRKYRGEPDRICKKWAVKGSQYCRTHGGRNTGYNDVRAPRVRFYSQHLGPRLAEAVEECLSAPDTEQLSLFQELAVVRSLAKESCRLHAMAEALPSDRADKLQMISAAAAMLSQQMEYIGTLCEKAARVDAMGKDKYSIHTLQDIVNQLGRMVHSCFGHDINGLMAFDKMLAEQLRLPVAQNQGTYRTPDVEAQMMDDTIPSAPHALIEAS